MLEYSNPDKKQEDLNSFARDSEASEKNLFPESRGHFDSFLRDLSAHELPNKTELASRANFDIVTEDFFEELERILKADIFKLPNLEDFETKTAKTTTPKRNLGYEAHVQLARENLKLLKLSKHACCICT